MFETKSFHNKKLISSKKLESLNDFVKSGQLKPGQRLTIVTLEDKNKMIFSSIKAFWVGDATPFHKPSTNDGGFGWNNISTDEFIYQVDTYG